MKLDNILNFDEFNIPTYDEWKEEAIKSLKGAPFEKKLFTQTLEDIVLKPIYYSFDVDKTFLESNSYPGFAPFIRGNDFSGLKIRKWHIAQTIPYYEPKEFNAALKDDIKNGQNAISIHINRNEYYQFQSEAIVCGTKLKSIDNLVQALDGIDLEKYPIYFKSGDFYGKFSEIFLEFLNIIQINPDELKGNLGADPFNEMMINGGSQYDIDQLITDLYTAYQKFNKFKSFGLITINGSAYHNSGANSIQELAYSFAYAVELINKLIDKGLTPKEIIPKIRFNFAVSSDFFMQIAKIRAARMIWAKIVKEYRLDENLQKLTLHCSTSIINKTKYDPWVNILRSSIECFAAILSNADSIDVGNFDFAYGYPSDFSRRISRNIQLVLQYEAHLLDTIDPVAGSYFLENITIELAQKAWSEFQKVIAEGGFWQNIENGNIQTQIQKTYEKQDQNYQSRRQILVGTNKYPLLNEKKPTDCKPFIINKIDDSQITPKALEIPVMLIQRFGAKFENLRTNAEKFYEEHNQYPEILLLNFGDLNEWKPRNDFSMDFLQVGGFQTIFSPIFNTTDEAINYLDSQSNAKIVCICSSDQRYETLLPELLPRIKINKPATYAILAGYPENKVEEYKSLGIDCFIHIKANVYETLKQIQIDNNIMKL